MEAFRLDLSRQLDEEEESGREASEAFEGV